MEVQQNEKDVPSVSPEHVKEEFCKWFESRGLLSDLRAYMRQLMVKALEDSNKSEKICQQKKASSSPKIQAINLLVVDYLFHEDYLYTVSVFASEAQILENLPQYSNYITQTVRERHRDPSSLPRFSAQETEDILDTLRLPPTQQDAKRASELYLTGHESLLTCIVRTLASPNNQNVQRSNQLNIDVSSEDHAMECSYQLWSEEMQDLLLLAGVKLQHIKRMQHKWSLIIEEEKLKVKQQLSNELIVDQENWQQKTEERIRCELSEEIQKEQQKLTEQRTEVESREKDLTSLAEQLSAVDQDISGRLSLLQLKNSELLEKEAFQEKTRLQLEERMSEVKLKEEYLENSISRFPKHPVENDFRDEYKKTEELTSHNVVVRATPSADASVQVDVNIQTLSTSTQTSDAKRTVSIQTLSTEDQEQQTSVCCEPDPQLLLQQQMERQKMNELQEENLELRARMLQQRTRIDELTNRAASLASQLEESRVAVAVLSGREHGVVVAQPSPPPYHPTSTFIAPTFGFNTPQRAGAGEESLFAPRPQQLPTRPDGRKRPLRFAFSQNPSPTSEESSPTDEVIQNARVRIRQLEEESVAIQRNYQQFQTRLLTTDSVMFPPLNSPRVHRNPIMRVRRNDVIPGFPFREAPIPPASHNMYAHRHAQNDNNDDSSSELSSIFYETARVEDMTRSRRIFSQRNIRQFDRWKQFKKKFVKRDLLDFNRRTVNVANNNTSSDDEELVKLDSRRLCKSNKSNKMINDKGENHQVHSPQMLKSCRNSSQLEPATENEEMLDKKSKSFIISPKNNSGRVREESIAFRPASEENHFKIKEQESLKLIDSVMTLLNDSHPGTSENSKTPLTLESLSKDNINDPLVSTGNITRLDNLPDQDTLNINNCDQKDNNTTSSYSQGNEVVIPLPIEDPITQLISKAKREHLESNQYQESMGDSINIIKLSEKDTTYKDTYDKKENNTNNLNFQKNESVMSFLFEDSSPKLISKSAIENTESNQYQVSIMNDIEIINLTDQDRLYKETCERNENKANNNHTQRNDSTIPSPPTKLSPELFSTPLIETKQSNSYKNSIDHSKSNLNEDEPVSDPATKKTPQELNRNNYDIAENEVEEQRSTSVTSGSDILQELNPSKSYSSDSVLSTGWAEGSKHSSDFWN